MENIREQLVDAKTRVSKILPALNLSQKKQKLLELTEASSQPGFWENREQAEKVSKQMKALENELAYWEGVEKAFDDLLSLLDIAEQEQDEGVKKDVFRDAKEALKKFQQKEIAILFSGKYDSADALLAVHAGTGGVDAQDFAEMLLRMYIRFCESLGFTCELVSESRGEEAGIKSAVFEVRGEYAYGYLHSEDGVHRLVRLSPFNADNLRQTSFALVEILPLVETTSAITIDPKDLRIDTYHSSGAGGQHVNKTESAIRIVHLPTKTTVEVQSERSQIQNKERALKLLKAKLQLLEEEKQQEEKQKIRGEYSEAAWGNQIRSYVLQPYQMVKDHRTGMQVGNTEAVFDGEIFPFVEAFLRNAASKKHEQM